MAKINKKEDGIGPLKTIKKELKNELQILDRWVSFV